jgi:radical SAM superfamily enzyme YgiQ (UPF0313 family)
MKITLVNPPNNYDDTYELAPPLGLLTLAAALQGIDAGVSIFDFNLAGVADHSFVDESFYEKAAALIAASEPDVVGLTSMVVNSHVALELARALRRQDRHVVIVLGGTHFSSIAIPVLTFYDWIDYVVQGEGERPFCALVRALRDGRRPTAALALPGVAFRDGETVVASDGRERFDDVDQLPWPAFELVDVGEYFALNPDRVLDYEPGRGCIYKCSFCYSPVHYGPGARARTADVVVEEMARLQELGARHLFFVQDNFLNNAKAARAACDAIAGANLSLTWNCYATLPQMTADVLAALGRAGCVNAFTGIDAVNEECQREYLKRFYRGWEPLERTLRTSASHGVTPTCAFLVENPTAGADRIDRTLVTALFAKCCGAGLRLNTLTLYNGTGSEAAFRGAPLSYSERKPRLLLDCPPLVEVNDYARVHPELFPFHNTFLSPAVWERFTTGMHVAYTLFHAYPMTLYRWATEDQGSLWKMIEAVVDELPDIVDVDPAGRRPLERATFAAWFERQQRMQRLTVETFELESAEQAAWNSAAEHTARLGFALGDLHRFDLHHQLSRGATRTITVRRGTSGLEYDESPTRATRREASINQRAAAP